MIRQVEFHVDRASEEAIANHLSSCDASFVPPLSDRVEIGAYAQKITRNATRFEAWDHVLLGLLAVYCNNQLGIAYITSVSVVQERRQQGIASRLLDQCIDFARRQGYRRLELEVDDSNVGAMSLYGSRGFLVDAVNGRTVIMRLDMVEGS